MGIRMKLAVGYGLDLNILGGASREALKYENIEDEALFTAFVTDVTAFADQTGEVMDKIVFVRPDFNPPKDLTDLIVYDDEFGLGDKLLLIPAGARKNWVRYGNLLDAFLYEAQLGDAAYNNGTASEWLPHPGTLYPYIGLMRPNAEKPLGVEKYWDSYYRDKPEHGDAVAWAPWHLWFVIKHLGLWPEDKTTEAFLSLRPTIYRYWC